MIQVSATEARRKFFRLLDSAAMGNSVIIDRHGVPIRLVRGPLRPSKREPDYKSHILGSVKNADRWSWDWHPAKGLVFRGGGQKKGS